MSLHYYNDIYPNISISKAILTATKSNLSKFEDYIDSAITSLKKRGEISIRWMEVDSGVEVKLTPLYTAIRADVPTQIRINWNPNYLVMNSFNNEAIIFPEEWIFCINSGKPVRVEDINVIYNGSGQCLFEYTGQDSINFENEKAFWDGKEYPVNRIKPNMISQNGNNNLEIISSNLGDSKNYYEIVLKGAIQQNQPLYVNSYKLNSDEWEITDSGQLLVLDEKEEEVPIVYQNGNVIYLDIPQTEGAYKIYIQGKPVPYKKITINDPTSIIANGVNIPIYKEKNKKIIYDKFGYNGTGMVVAHSEYPDYFYNLSCKEESTDSTTVWIELIDEDNDEDDESVSSKSKIDYFFEEDVNELEGMVNGRKVSFSVKKSIAETRRLMLANTEYRGEISYASLPGELSIPINIYQLKRQKEAIKYLERQPLLEHKSLLSLMENKQTSFNTWPSFKPKVIDEWYVLNEEREGVEAQRSFVQKALATPDFTLLEGPPGSGKTTAILELIVQLINNGKKLLLCASTHVAIDNVLERLMEKNLLNNIHPMRLGDTNRVSDDVNQFCYEKFSDNPFKNIILESSNLVCGTTIGILRHPLFASDYNQPSNPVFDYLIIDESSKTTFQEFLIPAMFAKKWILVGDIKQLSPYTDQGYIISNLENKLSYPTQMAALILHRFLFNKYSKADMPFCIVYKDEVIDLIEKQLEGYQEDEVKKNVGFFKNGTFTTPYGHYHTISLEECKSGKKTSWKLLGLDVLFVKESEYEELKVYIPIHFFILNRKNWSSDPKIFNLNGYYYKLQNKLRLNNNYKFDKTKDQTEKINLILEETNKFFVEKSWASEYSWRMMRVHSIRDAKKDFQLEELENDLRYLVPRNTEKEVMYEIETIKDIALPSILESLQQGVGKKSDNSYESVLNSGFAEHILSQRYEQLDFQHRMHPEISEFPRSQFYNNNALKDSNLMWSTRQWDYKRYSSRNMWINVNGKNLNGKNVNEQEVEILKRELIQFIQWAKEDTSKNWSVACLTFYNGQLKIIKEMLRILTDNKRSNSKFEVGNVTIHLYTVDKFQGREADITYLSMVKTNRDGFLDNVNRFNVAITRARYQRVIIGKYDYFSKTSKTDHLIKMANQAKLFEEGVGRNEIRANEKW